MNEKIRVAREAGLAVLKPTKKELEHGMALHRESIVCESYGFSPRLAIDSSVIIESIKKGASRDELIDLRESMSMTACVHDPGERKEYLEAWDEAGVTCVFECAGEECQAPLKLMKRLAHYTYVMDMMPESVSRATRVEDIEAAKKAGRHCMVLTCNGVPLTQNWDSPEDELRYIEIFFHLGCRMMHLTYQRRNMLGDGCGETDNAGLSDLGRLAVREMNRVGMIVDLAHSGEKTCLEAARVSSRPVVASHAGCAALSNHVRMKKDGVIRAIADTGGYVGIVTLPYFVQGSGDLNAVLDHIDHIARNFGPEHVTIGMDIGYGTRKSDAELEKLWAFKGWYSRPKWEGLWPANYAEEAKKFSDPKLRLSNAWTNWPLITVGLVQRGYKDEDIRKIIGGNILRVAREVVKDTAGPPPAR